MWRAFPRGRCNGAWRGPRGPGLALGRTDEADARLPAFIEQNQGDSAFQIAQIYGFRGDDDKVFEWLDRAYLQRDGGLPEIMFDPYLRKYWGDPRWAVILGKAGLYEAWVEHRQE